MQTSKLRISALTIAWALLALGEAAASNVRAGYPENWQALDSREVAMLPEYCKYTQTYRSAVRGGDDRAQIERWTAIIGPTFNALHHYCNGLLQTNRALLLATSAQWRMFYLDASIGEFDFVIDRATEDFRLLPEVLTKKGENLLRLGREPAGLDTLQKAISVKPDYWPPYLAIADHFERRGDRAQARQVLQKALQAAPDAKRVKDRLADLDKAARGK